MSNLQVWREFLEKNDENDEVNFIQLEDGSFWFQASHLCKNLDYKNTQVALQTHCEPYEIRKFDVGQHYDVNFVSESGFYSLILGSKKPKAKSFKKWVCVEVLPKLRADGFYIAQTDSATLERLEKEISTLRQQNLEAYQMVSQKIYENDDLKSKLVKVTEQKIDLELDLEIPKLEAKIQRIKKEHEKELKESLDRHLELSEKSEQYKEAISILIQNFQHPDGFRSWLYRYMFDYLDSFLEPSMEVVLEESQEKFKKYLKLFRDYEKTEEQKLKDEEAKNERLRQESMRRVYNRSQRAKAKAEKITKSNKK